MLDEDWRHCLSGRIEVLERPHDVGTAAPAAELVHQPRERLDVVVREVATQFGQPLVDSTLTLAIVTGMSVSDVSQKAIANLGWTDIRMPAPVFNGDTLYAESEVLEKRESKSRPTEGIVTIATRAYKADGTLVMEFKRTLLIPKRGHSIEDRIEAAKSVAV